MPNAIKQILEPYFGILPELRGTPSLWTEYKCEASKDEQGNFTDAGHGKRNNLLVALFYDQRSSDENLLRYLLRQEIEMHGKLTLKGVRESIKINVALLSRFRHADNIELFIRAKHANVNTISSLDLLSLVSPGISKSFDHLSYLSEEDRQTFINDLGASPEECTFSEEDASKWVNDQVGLLPMSLDQLSPEQEIELADLLGDKTVLNNKITAWIAGIKKWDKETAHALYGYETIRGNIQGQIDALKKIGEYEAERTENKQMNFFGLSELYLKLKDIDAAHKNICYSLANYPSETMTWETCRMYADRFLDIILATKDGHVPISIDSFTWLKNYLDYQPWLGHWDMKMIPRIMTACTMAGDSQLMKKFSELFIMRKKEQFDRLKG